MKEIPLTKGYVALVDNEDYETLARHRWYAKLSPISRTVYAVRQVRGVDGRQHPESMHRVITNAPAGMEVDHRDHNGLNNQRSNLRVVTHYENSCNLPMSRRNTSGYRGVHRRNKRWVAQIVHRFAHIHLGHFPSPEEAARAYDEAATRLRGKNTRLNFPEERGT